MATDRTGASLNTTLNSLNRHLIARERIILTSKVLGRGGFDDVRLGILQSSGTRVAVKEFRATGTLAQNRRSALALARGVRAWATAEHQHIVPLAGFHLSEDLSEAWVLSPYMKHGNVRDYIAQTKADEMTRLRLLFETADALIFLHSRNMIHGDVKGGNVLVDDEHRAKLCDFGLADIIESDPPGLTTAKGMSASLRYMGPELHVPGPTRTTRTYATDVWAWGGLALEVLVELLPYHNARADGALVRRILQGEPPADVEPLSIPDRVKSLLRRCWRPDPLSRPTIAECHFVVNPKLSAVRVDSNENIAAEALAAAKARNRKSVRFDSPQVHTYQRLRTMSDVPVPSSTESSANNSPAFHRLSFSETGVWPPATVDDDAVDGYGAGGRLEFAPKQSHRRLHDTPSHIPVDIVQGNPSDNALSLKLVPSPRVATHATGGSTYSMTMAAEGPVMEGMRYWMRTQSPDGGWRYVPVVSRVINGQLCWAMDGHGWAANPMFLFG